MQISLDAVGRLEGKLALEREARHPPISTPPAPPLPQPVAYARVGNDTAAPFLVSQRCPRERVYLLHCRAQEKVRIVTNLLTICTGEENAKPVLTL